MKNDGYKFGKNIKEIFEKFRTFEVEGRWAMSGRLCSLKAARGSRLPHVQLRRPPLGLENGICETSSDMPFLYMPVYKYF